jgi:VanZ family protein
MGKGQKLVAIARWWSMVLAIASLVVIVVATIYPFRFVIPQNFSIFNIFQDFDRTSHLKDYGNNIVLFMPWGFSLSGILRRRKINYLAILILVLIASFALSLTVETVQVFLPRRASNFADITFNTIGGGVGGYLYWRRKPIGDFIRALVFNHRQRLTPKSVGAVFLGYFFLIYLLVFSLLINVNLSNWERFFPLIIGNESTADRPWEGRIKQLHISDRALSLAEITAAFDEKEVFWLKSGNSLASYLFSAKNNEKQSNFANLIGNNPQLFWHVEISKVPVKPYNSVDSVLLESNRWLKTRDAVQKITNNLKKSNQFTWAAIVATNNIKQVNLPRIISLSGNPFYRNFTIAQEEKSLILRLRTPTTGVNGNEPELMIPEIFTDLDFHYLIFTFDSHKLDCYIDRPDNKYTFVFEPEISIWSFFPVIIPAWRINLADFNKLFYRLGFYSILFIPLGFLAGSILSFFNRQKLTQIILIITLCLIPPFLIEQLYVTLFDQPMRIFNLILSTAILLVTTLIFNKIRK